MSIEKKNNYIKISRDTKDIVRWTLLESLFLLPLLIFPFYYWKSILFILPLFACCLWLQSLKYKYSGHLIINNHGIWIIRKKNGAFEKEEFSWKDIEKVVYRTKLYSGRTVWYNQFLEVVQTKKERIGYKYRGIRQTSTIYLDDFLPIRIRQQFLSNLRKREIIRNTDRKESYPIYEKSIDYCLRQYCDKYHVNYMLSLNNENEARGDRCD